MCGLCAFILKEGNATARLGMIQQEESSGTGLEKTRRTEFRRAGLGFGLGRKNFVIVRKEKAG